MSLTALGDTAVATNRVTAAAHDFEALADVPVQPPELDKIELREYGSKVVRLSGEQASPDRSRVLA